MATNDKNEQAAVTRKRTTKVGVVVSNKMQKTVVVAVENLVKHGMYQKYIKRTNKFLAHNEQSDINIGDRVVIEETDDEAHRHRLGQPHPYGRPSAPRRPPTGVDRARGPGAHPQTDGAADRRDGCHHEEFDGDANHAADGRAVDQV